MILKDLRVFLQRLSQERIDELKKSYHGRPDKNSGGRSGSGQQWNPLLPKKIGRRHHCPECNYSCIYRWTVVEHIRIHTGEKYVCNFVYCAYTCAQKSQLRRHSNLHKLKPFQCRICPFRFDREDDLDTHVNVKHFNSKREFKCKLCGNVYSSSRGLKNHLTAHTGEKNIVCRICWESFSWYYQLKDHENTVHLGKGRQNYKCSICECSYLNKSSLNTHMAQKHDENPKKFNCKFCDKYFLTSTALTDHLRSHTGEKPFGCNLCPFKSSQNSNLQTHIKRIHTKDKPYKCEICSKGFPYKSELDYHSKVHTGEKGKVHKCSECQKTFLHKKTLKSHMRIHTGEKPYTCSFCNKNFRHSTTLLFHTRTHTKESVKKIQCSECASKFNSFAIMS